MEFIADFHLHSHFSRATARDLVPEDLSVWAQKKGIALIGSGDFTHPGWVEELRENLVEAESGLFRLRPDLERAAQSRVPPSCRAATRYILSGEISCIYKRGGKTRKVHNVVLLPDFNTLDMLNRRLERIGNLRSDGRPILGLDSRDLLEIVLESSEQAFFIPAHIWTPWFSLLGSRSGFDAIEECFADLTPHIHALETGLSSDPAMNRLLSKLDPYVLVSNSDAHSPAKLGREANLFDTELDYGHIVNAMIQRSGFHGTIEFFPEEGKYHIDGHRKCLISLQPAETRACKGICPVCGKPLTVGVLHRVYALADREVPKEPPAFCSLIPLLEILSEVFECGPSSRKVPAAYEELLARLGPEITLLRHTSLEAIGSTGGALLAEAIRRMREHQVIKQEGYDGEYGVIRLFHESEKRTFCGQKAFFPPAMASSGDKKKDPPFEKGKPAKKETEERLQSWLFDPILSPLNDAQKDAVLHEGGHLLIVAGPGTGKTLTLTHRIAYQVRSGQVRPEEILALTFTNKASREMETRLASLIPGAGIRAVTFHAFCLRVLRNHHSNLDLSADFMICSEEDALMIARQVMENARKGPVTLPGFLKALPLLKRAGLMDHPAGHYPEGTQELFDSYQERLRSLSLLDLDDLEVETLRLFQNHPDILAEWARRFPWIYVDEYQDTNLCQVQILRSLAYPDLKGACTSGRAPRAVHVCAIGDPDQAIYGFRGADVGNFLRFAGDFPEARRIVLFRNYRSSQVVLDGAAGVLGKEESLQAVSGLESPIAVVACKTPAEEAEMVVEQIEKIVGGTTHFSIDSGRVASHEEGEDLGFGDIAVLFRLNFQGDAFEQALSRAGIPCVRSGEKPLSSRYPADVLRRFLQGIGDPSNPYYREAYLGLRKHYRSDRPTLAPRSKIGLHEEVVPMTPRQLIDWAVRVHGFDGMNGEADRVVRRFKEVCGHFTDLKSLLDALSLERGLDHAGLLGDRVALMSIHAAKGLEWPVVFIAGCEQGLLPCTLFGDRDDEEERRLFYVGMTRTRSRLILSRAVRREINGRMRDMKPSPFLECLPANLLAPLERGKWKAKRVQRQLALF